METPPLLPPNPVTGPPASRPVNLARLGMLLSLVGPAVFLLFTILRPG